MKKNPFIIILEYLEEHGLVKLISINHILIEIFNTSNNPKEEEKENLSREIKELLNIMEAENLLTFDMDGLSRLGSGGGGNLQWFDTLEIKARIKSQGIVYLMQEKNQKFIESVNQSVIDTNKVTRDFIPFQKKLTTASFLISLVALGFSIIPIFKDNNKEIRFLIKLLIYSFKKLIYY